jgi:dihydrolipoamide dehydrogenase
MAGTYARTTEVLVIGGGPAGYMAAIRAGQLGKKVLLVEQNELGGECLNRGCIPSKALIHASELLYHLRTEGAEIGVRAPDASFDLAAAMRWKNSVVEKERLGVQSLLRSAGATALKGTARFSGPRSALLAAADGGQERIDFTDAVIASGAVPIELRGFETDGERVVNAWQLLDLKRLPASMLVLGGGVSGCELGEFLARVGVRVTIVEMLSQLLPGMDADLSRELTRALEKLGVRVLTSTKAVKLDRAKDGVTVTVEATGTSELLPAEMLFVTIGKRADTRSLGLEEAGVLVDAQTGFIPTNDRMQTNVANIYAAGDVTRPPMLAHKAYREGIVAAEAIAGRPTRFDYQTVPSVVFTEPELASVGLTLGEASQRGFAAREARFPFMALGRAHANHATDGWVKLVGDDPSGLLLGIQAAGVAAGEFISEGALAIEMGATVRDIAGTIHPHPTFAEALAEAALLWLDEPMHVMRRTRDAKRG